MLALSMSPGSDAPRRALCRAILGPTRKPDTPRPTSKQQVNDRDRPDAAADQFLQPLYGGINEIGKKNGKEEENQRASRRIKKTQPDGEQYGRE